MDRENHPSKTTPEHVMGQTGDRSMRPPPPPQPSERIGLAGSPKWSNQPPLTKIFYKTKLCEKFETNGRCIYLDRCTFAHGVAELRRPSFAQGPTIRNPGEMKMVEAQKSGIPPAQASSGRAFPSMPTPTMLNYPRQIPEEKEGVAKISNLERLSRKKTSGIYGDWPEQY